MVVVRGRFEGGEPEARPAALPRDAPLGGAAPGVPPATDSAAGTVRIQALVAMRCLIEECIDEFATVRSPEARLVTVPGIVGLDGMTGAAGALRLQVHAKRRLR